MGVWGTGIFQDDTACDLRDEYRQLLGDGLSDADAKAGILKAYSSSFASADESTVAWLALAATQWRLGRLDPDSLEHALKVIDSGLDLARWSVDSGDRDKRKAALEKLREQISSPQPAPKASQQAVALRVPLEGWRALLIPTAFGETCDFSRDRPPHGQGRHVSRMRTAGLDRR